MPKVSIWLDGDFEEFQSKVQIQGSVSVDPGKGRCKETWAGGSRVSEEGFRTQNKSACICVLASTVAFQLAYSPEVISHHLFGGSEVMRIMMQKIMREKVTLHITTGLSRRLQGAPARRRYWGSTNNSALPGAQRV